MARTTCPAAEAAEAAAAPGELFSAAAARNTTRCKAAARAVPRWLPEGHLIDSGWSASRMTDKMKSASEWNCSSSGAAPPEQDTGPGGGSGRLRTSRTASAAVALLPHLAAAVSCVESTPNPSEEACTDEAIAACPKAPPGQNKIEAVILEAAAEPGPSEWTAATGRAAETAGSPTAGFHGAEWQEAEAGPAEEDACW